jgi:diaminopimelate decarboxylase
MHDFQYSGDELHCEKVPITRIARDVGTPFYLYSRHTLTEHFRVFDSAFKTVPHITAYAVKANSNLAILRLLAREGSGADIVSGGELYRALKAGMDPRKIVFAGVGKSREEIREALKSKILLFNVESPQELALISEVAAEMKTRAPIALRVNPHIDPKTHPYIATGLKKAKFGISIKQAIEEFRTARSIKHLDIIGIHSHIGSQLTQIQPFVEALERTLELAEEIQKMDLPLQYLNIGGGLGITYEDEEPPSPQDLAQVLLPLLEGKGFTLILEPGRVLVGNAGILVTQVLYHKSGEEKQFVVVDAGMNDLIRPTLYEAYHEIRPVLRRSRPERVVDVVGPICESGDFLALDRPLPESLPGELLAVMSAGAYGFSMASNYNARPRVPEILVDEDQYEIIRQRESLEDLIRGEQIPKFLK